MNQLPPLDDAELDRLLADNSVWVHPPAALEEQVVDAMERAAGSAKVVVLDVARGRRRARLATAVPWIATVVAAAIAVILAVNPLHNGPSHQFAAALTGTDLAPAAHAAADFENKTNGVEVRVDVHGLPRAPAGSYYEAWLKGDHGLVPIGTFHSAGAVTLWSGVEISRFPQITMTVESDDGNPASSGRRVLTGNIVPSR